VHPDPENALSDPSQALSLEQVQALFDAVGRVAQAVNRSV
jgi:3-deoxy-D-arabino-heptulosonate 7-phosphate (DAHP) synthase